MYSQRQFAGFTAAIALIISADVQCPAQTPADYVGAWAFALPDGNPAWLKLSLDDTQLQGQLLWSVGSAKPVQSPRIDNGTLVFQRRINWKPYGEALVKRVTSPFHGTIADGSLHLKFTQITMDDQSANPEHVTLIGHRIPAPPAKPDLNKVRWGQPITLFNGKNLAGWTLSNPKKKNGWRAEDGMLVNESPKQDFAAYGDHGNLMTQQSFTDFELTLEYNVPAGGNSGIYLRGMYEAQVVDRDSRMQGIQGPGAIFGRLAPDTNAANPGGEWNTYVLTLVDRHITVMLNGRKVIDNQLLEGCTGGGIQADDMQPGPIFLQGDHTSVRYRNISLRPVVATERTVASGWDLNRLSHAPEFQWLDSESPIRSLTYEGARYREKPTRVFAYYATPGTISGDTTLDRNLPAVVLVHGGGGTAFADWVWLWAQRGYAAIAMDLSGRQPAAPEFRNGQLVSNLRVERTRLPDGGPEQGHPQKFNSIGGDVTDDWPWHAVSSVIRAHSLIRSFDEVDANRTALTGISWGGYTTCLVASVDHRFQAAVPVYGCGFLYDGESVQRPAIDALTTDARAEWIRRYDPSSHLAQCVVPILFVNGTNDPHYPLRSYSRSFQRVPVSEKQMRIEVNMRHGHQPGWEPKEIGLFIDHHLNGTAGLPVLSTPMRKATEVSVAYTSDVPLASASLHFTVDDGLLVKRKWQTVPATFSDTTIHADNLPADATIWFLSATDQRDAMTSTDVRFIRKKSGLE